MDALDAIMTRRSVRSFSDREVDDETVHILLDAAMNAPSAGNEQPWHFLVIRDEGTRSKVPEIHPYAKMAVHAPVSILVCGDEALQKYQGYWVQDCSAATENLLLAARALGLGAVWCGVYPIDERVSGFRKLCGVPDSIVPFALVPLGYPAVEQGKTDRFIAGRVHQDSW